MTQGCHCRVRLPGVIEHRKVKLHAVSLTPLSQIYCNRRVLDTPRVLNYILKLGRFKRCCTRTTLERKSSSKKARTIDMDISRRCGGSLAALQNTEAVVPGSNPASLTLSNSEDRQSHCVFCKISGQKGKPPPAAKKEKEKMDISTIFVKTLVCQSGAQAG